MLGISIILLLTSNAITFRRDKSILYARVAFIILVSCILIVTNNFYIEFFENSLGLFGGLYYSSALSQLFHVFLFLVTALLLQLNGFYPRKVWVNNISSIFNLIFSKLVHINNLILNKMKEQFTIIEYPLIILFVVIGGSLLLASSDLISIYLSVELQSYGLYILCAIYRNSERSVSGALIYFLLGGLSSCFILLSSGLIYSNSGNTNMDGLYIVNFMSNLKDDIQIIQKYIYVYDSQYIHFSLAILSIGFLFKISAAPFHFWSPDVYDGIPTVVTAFVAVFAKISIFILLLELVHYTSDNIMQNGYTLDKQNDNASFSWTYTLLISSFMSLIIGSILGLIQSRIKRLYAYSTISHVGFILLALTINTIESVQSFIFYIVQYSLSNLNAFILLIYIGYSLYFHIEKQKVGNENSSESESEAKSDNINKVSSENHEYATVAADKNNSPIQLIDQIKGYFFVNPLLGLSFSITIFSFVGIPPLIGFFAKQMVLNSAIYNGYIFMALIAIITSVISAYYYLTLVKQVFFFETDYNKDTLAAIKLEAGVYSSSTNNTNVNYNLHNVYLTSSISTTISILSLIILIFMFIPQEWLNLANILALILFNT